MRTIKRQPADIKTSNVKNTSKYQNQMNFKGILQTDNIFAADQTSLCDSLNVYIDDNQSLISREPLTPDNIPADVVPSGFNLIDLKYIKDITIYISTNGTSYSVIAIDSNNVIKTVNGLFTEYNVTIFYQYVICFKNTGAVVLDSNNYANGWQAISNFADIPITKIITGSDTEVRDNNKFTTSYKEQYIRKTNIITQLPTNETPVNVEILTDQGTCELRNFYKADKFTEDRLYTLCNFSETSTINLEQVSVHNERVCIAVNNGFYLSLTYGKTFEFILYPEYIRTNNILVRAQLSEDGRAVFVIAKKCVYRCLLGDAIDNYVWETIFEHNDSTKTISIDNYIVRVPKYKFVNYETFMFVTYAAGTDEETLGGGRKLYFKGQSLYDTDPAYENTLCCISLNNIIPYDFLSGFDFNNSANYNKQSFVHTIFEDARQAGAFTIKRNYTDSQSQSTSTNYVIFFIGGNNAPVSIYSQTYTPSSIANGHMTITDISNSVGAGSRNIVIRGVDSGSRSDNANKYYINIAYTDTNNQWSNYSYSLSTLIASSTFGSVFIKIKDNLYTQEDVVSYSNGYLIDTSTSLEYNVPKLFKPDNTQYTISQYIPAYNNTIVYYQYDNLYSSADDTIYGLASAYLSNSTAILTYQFTDNSIDNIINLVPDRTYSGSELYLTYNNTIMITNNNRDGENILFNITKLNNQSFANTITAIINISTTELAIFFENGITVCTKTADDTFGYVYTYSKTRLTLGTKYGDSVLNTADGANSLFATSRGLAIMNYQAYMATSDQTLQFVSDNIIQLWNEFYAASTNITLLQLKNYIFIYNQTNTYLMLDLRQMSWWKFRVPHNIVKLLTNQIQLKLISDKLYSFNKLYSKGQYFDDGIDRINWYIVSQRLHFDLPNHYKNIKQLVFQTVKSSDFEIGMSTEIKLFRKVIDYREPEIIRFKIDEFRTFVKRFNYWKINELQWALAADEFVSVPAQLILNGIGIKYEIGEEVR